MCGRAIHTIGQHKFLNLASAPREHRIIQAELTTFRIGDKETQPHRDTDTEEDVMNFEPAGDSPPGPSASASAA